MAFATQSLRRLVIAQLERGFSAHEIAKRMKGDIGRASVYRYAQSWEGWKTRKASESKSEGESA